MVRQVAAAGYIFYPKPNNIRMEEAETNANTCCLGMNFVLPELIRRVAYVYKYDKIIKPIENIPIISY